MDARNTFRLTTVTAAAAAPGIRGGARSAKPVSEVSAGVGYATNDGRQFGQGMASTKGAPRAVRLYLNRRRRRDALAALDGRWTGAASCASSTTARATGVTSSNTAGYPATSPAR